MSRSRNVESPGTCCTVCVVKEEGKGRPDLYSQAYSTLFFPRRFGFFLDLRYVFPQILTMGAQNHAAWANRTGCLSHSGAASWECKAATKAKLVMSSHSGALKPLQFPKTSSSSSLSRITTIQPQFSSQQWKTSSKVAFMLLLRERTFLRCSHETSVQVGSDVVVDDVNDSLKRMRELVDIAGGKSEGVDDASLTRFLVGFSMDVEVAAKAFAKHQEWEAFIKPRGFISETEIPNELNAKKSYLQGRDKQGRPISVILARNHFNNKDVDEFRRFIVYSMDKILASSSTDGKLNVIIDLKGLGLKNLDSKAFIEGFDIYQSHYPERIEKFYMVNAPFIFNGLWKVVSPFISEITRKKIEFVSNKKVEEVLLTVIDANQLPVEYGGKAELVLLQDAVVPGWPPVIL